jgi:hypothetical protein
MKKAALLLSALALGGCASIVNDSTHGVRVETRTASGQMVSGAECALVNDYGTTTMKSGSTQAVRRSSKDLDITCTQPGQPPASGRAISRANAGLAGNIIFGGVVGAVIDHNKGTAYTYPTWIQLVFGQSLVFDRTDEKEGTPVPGRAPGAVAAAATAAPSSNVSTGCSQGAMPCR